MRLYPESPIQPDDWVVGWLGGGPKTLQLSLRHLSWHSLPGRTLFKNVRLIIDTCFIGKKMALFWDIAA
jgi:hypothetical protein